MSFLSKIFNSDDEEFDEVCVDKELLDAVIYYSKQSYPNEFLAFFDGEIKDKKLYLTSLIFIPGETGATGAVVRTDMLPPTLKYWGSVHSHPGLPDLQLITVTDRVFRLKTWSWSFLPPSVPSPPSHSPKEPLQNHPKYIC